MALPKPMVGAPINATGGIAAGPVETTPLPTNATSDLDMAFVRLGLVGEDGVTLTREKDTDDKKAWGGSVVRTVQNSVTETLSFTLLESDKAEVLKEVYGEDNVTVAQDSIAITHDDSVLENRAFVVDMKDGKRRRRLVIPNGQITSTGDVQYVHSEIISYEVTLTAYADEAGKNIYEYIDTVA